MASPSATRVLLPQLHPARVVLERERQVSGRGKARQWHRMRWGSESHGLFCLTQVPLMWRLVEPVPREKADPRDLMSRIKGTTSWQEMQQVYSSAAANFNNTHTCAAITHLAQLVCRLGPEAVRGFPNLHGAEQHDLQLQHQERLRSNQSASSSGSPQNLTAGQSQGYGAAWPANQTLQHGLNSRVHHTDVSSQHSRSRTALPHAVGLPEQLQPRQLVRLSETDVKLLGRLMQQVAANIKQCKVRQLANCIWAIAKIEHATGHAFKPSMAWVGTALVAAEYRLAAAEPQHIASIAYALALSPTWLLSSKATPRLLQGLFAAAHSKLGDFKLHELANLLWAAGTLHKYQVLREDDSSAAAGFLMAAMELASKRAEELKPQELCNVLWAMGKLCATPQQQVRDEQGSVGGEPPAALLRHPSIDCMAGLLQQADAVVSQLTPVGLASLILSLGLLDMPRRVAQGTGTAASAAQDRHAEAYLGSQSWVANLLASTQGLLPYCRPTELTSLILGVAHMGIQPEGSWLELWQDAAFSQLGTFSAQELSNSIWALSRLRVTLTRRQLAQVLLASAACMPDMAAAEAAQLLPALAELKCKPSKVSGCVCLV